MFQICRCRSPRSAESSFLGAVTCSRFRYCPLSAKTFARSRVRLDGTIEDLAPHLPSGGDAGYPVFTEFGADLPSLLERGL